MALSLARTAASSSSTYSASSARSLELSSAQCGFANSERHNHESKSARVTSSYGTPYGSTSLVRPALRAAALASSVACSAVTDVDCKEAEASLDWAGAVCSDEGGDDTGTGDRSLDLNSFATRLAVHRKRISGGDGHTASALRYILRAGVARAQSTAQQYQSAWPQRAKPRHSFTFSVHSGRARDPVKRVAPYHPSTKSRGDCDGSRSTRLQTLRLHSGVRARPNGGSPSDPGRKFCRAAMRQQER